MTVKEVLGWEKFVHTASLELVVFIVINRFDVQGKNCALYTLTIPISLTFTLPVKRICEW